MKVNSVKNDEITKEVNAILFNNFSKVAFSLVMSFNSYSSIVFCSLEREIL